MKWKVLSVVLLLAASVSAQYIVTGKVVNATTGDPIELATVRLFRDSTMLQGSQADLDGTYYLQRVEEGRYELVVSSIGYVEKKVSVEVSAKKGGTAKVITVATIRLSENVQALGEVDVKGQAAEMVVKGDTIEYNTAAYKVGENAMVEDLLKKMNGVEVDREGNVTINGEQITGVRIDGKKFFGDDVQSATKNIPAEMIEKIQVIDEKSETAKMTGFEDDETERIINLTLKENRKKGLFGNYNAGLGADMVTANEGWFNYADPEYGSTAGARARHFFEDDFRYTAGLFTNILLGESQTTIIGSANNTNDIRSSRGRGSFSGSNNSGITWSENLGVNTNVDLSKHLRRIDSQTSMAFGGDGTLNHSYNTTTSQATKDSYSGDETYHNLDSTSKKSYAWDVQARLELEYQIDTLNKLLIQPRLTFTNSRSDGHSAYQYSRLSDETLMSDGYQNRFSNSDEIGARIRAIYNHKFLRRGRSLTLTGNVQFTDTKGRTDTYSYDNLGDSAKVNQYTNSGNDAVNMRLRASYVEPIYGVNHFLETVLMFGTNLRESHKDQYDTTSVGWQYNNDYSNRLTNRFYQESVGVNYRYIKDNVDLTVGAQFNPSQTHNMTYYGDVLHRDTTIYAWNWSPNMRFKYNFGKKEFARIFYRGSNTQPSVTQMEPVRNNSDAMNETVGNLGLKPAFKHSLHAMYSKFNAEKFWSIMGGLHGNVTQDALVNNTVYDETGKLYQQTVNAQGIPWDVSADLMFNTPFANKLMQFHTRTEIGYNRRIAYVNQEGQSSQIVQWIEMNTFGLGQESRTGNLRLNESLTLRLTHDIVDVGVVGSVVYSRTDNNLVQNSVTNVVDWTVTGDIQFHLPKSWNISADCGYTARYGYTGLTDVNEILLNASVDKTWNAATLSLKAFDILHQKKNIVQTVGENYVRYQKANTLPTYFLLTFTYKFNRMGDLKAKGMGGHIQEMIESGNDPSRGGMPPMMRF